MNQDLRECWKAIRLDVQIFRRRIRERIRLSPIEENESAEGCGTFWEAAVWKRCLIPTSAIHSISVREWID
jgi:hypothetical protein